MRTLFLSFILLFGALLFAQQKNCDEKNLNPINCHQLTLNFDSVEANTEKIHWSKFQQLTSLEIYGYSNDSKPLKGFQKANIKNLAINHSDIVSFFSKNRLPLSIEKLTIWLDGRHEDTIVVPRKISTLINLRYFSIGCCANLSFEDSELSQLINLDTLIVEGPVTNLKFLYGMSDLKYLGFWSPSLSDFKREIDSILPNTEKEAWCFPSDQIIQMWSGETKFVSQVLIGDTIIGYNFQTQEIIPCLIEQVEKHSPSNYLFGTIQESDLIASMKCPLFFQESISVKATIYHPIAITGGRVSLGDLEAGAQYYFLTTNRTVENRVINNLHFTCYRDEVYNFKTSGDNYFVGNVLFLEK